MFFRWYSVFPLPIKADLYREHLYSGLCPAENRLLSCCVHDIVTYILKFGKTAERKRKAIQYFFFAGFLVMHHLWYESITYQSENRT